MAKRKAKFMQKAVKRPGALTKKADAAGQSPMAFAKANAHAPGLTGEQARFAMIAQGDKIPAKGKMRTATRAGR